jgi:hypothetical protein
MRLVPSIRISTNVQASASFTIFASPGVLRQQPFGEAHAFGRIFNTVIDTKMVDELAKQILLRFSPFSSAFEPATKSRTRPRKARKKSDAAA